MRPYLSSAAGGRAAARGRACLALAALFAATGCKNSLNYAPPGGPLGCGDPGAICTVGDPGIGDGGPALEATFVYPVAMARDAANGNLYIADRAQNRIRVIDGATGDIETLAGTGEESYAFVPGLAGDETLVASPISVAVTDDGTVFWADERTCAIYAVNPTSGTVSVAAGSRCSGSSGSGVTPDTVLFDFQGCSRLRAVGNDLLIPSTERNEIRYWNRGSTPVTVAGVTVQPGEVPTIHGLLQPCDADMASDGTLYAIEADYEDCRVRSVSPGGGVTFLVGSSFGSSSPCGNGASGVPSSSSQVNYPTGLDLDETNGLLFITDDSMRVRAINLGSAPVQYATVTLGSGYIGTIAGTGTTEWLLAESGLALDQPFRDTPGQPFLDGTDLIVPDPSNNVIRRVNGSDGTMTVIAGLGGDGTLADFVNEPSSIALLSGGDVLVAGRSARIWRQSDGGREVFAGTGNPVWSGDGGAAAAAGLWATGIAVDRENGRLYVADAYNHRIRVTDLAGATISTVAGNGSCCAAGDGDLAVNAQFNGPFAVLVSSGNLFISDEDRIRYVNLGLGTVTVAGTAVAPGNIETLAGGYGSTFFGDGGPASDAAVSPNVYYSELATGMALHDGALYFADTFNNRIRKIDLATGIIDTVVGSGAGGGDAVGRPVGLAIEDGWLYWTQLEGNYVKRMQVPSGAVEVVAGDGNLGYFGEGVHASQSQLIAPQGLAVGGGTVYVTDASHRVRRIRP